MTKIEILEKHKFKWNAKYRRWVWNEMYYPDGRPSRYMDNQMVQEMNEEELDRVAGRFND